MHFIGLILGIVTLFVGGCSKSVDSENTQGIDSVHLLLDIDINKLGAPLPPSESTSFVRVGIFLSVPLDSSLTMTEEDAIDVINAFMETPYEILNQCGVGISIEAAQVIALPDYLLRIQGNQEGSWGGHPPTGTDSIEQFVYEENEQLTDDVRELFQYGKTVISPNAISIFTVEHIAYFAEQQLTAAGGLSYPPNAYHRLEDYPLRNSVLVNAKYPFDALSFLVSWRIAHELGHMLLNVSDHVRDTRNLMHSGTLLAESQCEQMHRNIMDFYGSKAVPDPGISVDSQ